MAIWTNVVAGFDNADETFNFGTRAVAHGDQSIYETYTLATIQPSDKADLCDLPKCSAKYSLRGVGVAIDKTFLYFDESCGRLLFTRNFTDPIVCFELCHDHGLAFVGITSNQLYCVGLQADNNLWGVTIPSSQNEQITRIVSVTEDHSIHVYCVMTSGAIYELSKDPSNNNTISYESTPHVEQVQTARFKGGVVSSGTFAGKSFNGNGLLMCDSSVLYSWSPRDGLKSILRIPKSMKIVKLEVSPIGDRIIFLTERNKLYAICPETMIYFEISTEEDISDFVFTILSIDNEVLSSLLVLTASKDVHLCAFDVDSRKFKFRLKIDASNFVSLVDCQFNVEETLYLELFGERIFDVVRIKSLSHTQPEFRLERLLQRAKFSEAKDFARVFNLDQEVVVQAEVKWLMGLLQIYNATKDTLHGYYETLRNLLKEAEDVEFVANVCINTIAPDMYKTKELIEYAMERLQSSSLKGPSLDRIRSSVLSANVTLGTYIRTYGIGASPSEWLAFSTATPIIICRDFLAQGKINEACTVLMRHRIRIENELAAEMGSRLLEIIPTTSPTSSILKWLKHYTPVLFASCVDSAPLWASWVTAYAKNMELSDSTGWPESALCFISSARNILDSVLHSSSLSPHTSLAINQGRNLPESPVNKLDMLFWDLQNLVYLKNELSIVLSFDPLSLGLETEESFGNLIPTLFDRVQQHEIPKLMQFIKKLDIIKDLSKVISKYIIEKAPKYSSWWGSFALERKCVAFIQFIDSIPDKLMAVDAIVAWAKVPWHPSIEELVEKAVQIEHTLVSTILRRKKDLPTKIVLQKYGLSLEKTDMTNLKRIIMFIYCQGNDEMLDDAKELVSHEVNSEKLVPYSCYLLHHIGKGAFEHGLEILKRDLDPSSVVEVLKTVTVELKILMGFRNLKNKQLYAEALTMIQSLMKNSCENNVTRSGCKSIPSAASALKKVMTSSEGGIETFTSTDSPEVWDKHSYRCLDNTLNKFLETLKLSSDPHWIQNSIRIIKENVLTMNWRSGVISKIVMSAVEAYCRLGVPNIQLVTDIYDLAVLNYIYSSSLITLSNMVHKTCEVIHFHGSDFFKPPWFHGTFEPTPNSVPPLPHSLVSNLFTSILGSSGVTNGSFEQERINSDVVLFMSKLPTNMSSMKRVHDLTHLLLYFRLLTESHHKNIEKETRPILSYVLKNVFLSSRTLDIPLAINLIHYFPVEKAFECLLDLSRRKKELKWTRDLSSGVELYCKIHSEEICGNIELREKSNYFHKLHILSTWAIRAQRYKIPYKEACVDTPEDQKQFLVTLMTHPSVDLTVLEQYCSDHELDLQDCYIRYLKHLLISWEPKYTIINLGNAKKIVFENNSSDLLVKCQRIIIKIKNREWLLCILFDDVWKQVNTYYYEVFSVIVDLANHSSSRCSWYKLVLNFLMSYTRKGPALDDESTEWLNANPGIDSLPEISKYRLPFKKCPFDRQLIEPELSLDTYKFWLKNSSLLVSDLHNPNVICSIAVKNMVNKSSGSWSHDARLLEKITECIECMTDEDDSVSLMSFVVNRLLPAGLDRVKMAQTCFIVTNKWDTVEKSDKSKEAMHKAEKKYFTVSVEYVLDKHGLAQQKYLSLALKPTELIHSLFHDESITDGSLVGLHHQKKCCIHDAAAAIASLYNLSITRIALELLNQWLLPESALNSTFSGPSPFESNNNDSDNLTRAFYLLLKFRESDEIRRFLVNQAFSMHQNGNITSYGARLRALQCLLTITTIDELEMVVPEGESMKNDMEMLNVLSQLENMGLVYSKAAFEDENKENIISTLLQSDTTSAVPSVKLAACISILFKINNSPVWSSILKKMISLDMATEVEEILRSFDVAPLDTNIVKEAWNFLIRRSLRNAEETDGGFCNNGLEKTLELISTCPDPSFLNAEHIRDVFKRANRLDDLENCFL